MQSKMRGKINLQLGTLNSQKLQLSAVEKALLRTPGIAHAPLAGAGAVGPAHAVVPLPVPVGVAGGVPKRIPEPNRPLPQPHPTVQGVWKDNAMFPPAKSDLSAQLKQVESKLAAEAQAKAQAANSQAKKGPNRDMKKILESYKGTNANKGNVEAILVAEQQRDGNQMTPIQWLRHFWKNDLKIDVDLKEICFGRQKSFPR